MSISDEAVEAAAAAMWHARPMIRTRDGAPLPFTEAKKYQRDRYRGQALTALVAAQAKEGQVKNVFDDIAELADKYGNAHEAAIAAGDIEKAEAYRAITLDLCEIIMKRGGQA